MNLRWGWAVWIKQVLSRGEKVSRTPAIGGHSQCLDVTVMGLSVETFTYVRWMSNGPNSPEEHRKLLMTMIMVVVVMWGGFCLMGHGKFDIEPSGTVLGQGRR